MASRTRLGSSCTFITALSALSVSLQGCAPLVARADIPPLAAADAETHAPAELVRVKHREQVIVRLRNGTSVAGRYVGTRGRSAIDLRVDLLADTGQNPVSVKVSDVSSIALQVTGKGWVHGGLIGLVADSVVVLAVVVAAQNMQITVFDDPSGCFC